MPQAGAALQVIWSGVVYVGARQIVRMILVNIALGSMSFIDDEGNTWRA